MAAFWGELAKRDPHESTLLDSLQDIEDMDDRIRRLYTSITRRHSLSVAVMDPLTNNYCQFVWNVEENDGVHVIKKAKEGKEGTKGNTGSLHEDTRLFSADSRTPICLVSAEGSSMGQIVKSNIEFDRAVAPERGRIPTIESLLVPEMQQWHS
jgi:hypothetical protein